MKRTRTLASYFSRVPGQQGTVEAEQQPAPSPTQEQQAGQQGPPLQSQGTEKEQVSIRTRGSAAQAHIQPEEVITGATTSLPAVDLVQPPVEQTGNENVDFVEEEGGSNQVLHPQDIYIYMVL